MGLPRSVRLGADLETKVKNYLKKNNIKFSQLLKLAVEKFISEPQTIELVPADTHTFLKGARAAYAEHEDALDKLK
ncbi:MAG TPA: hypothetical protein VI895_10340 [Bdellovibrionota bacterium]|nr:hypothetical protein [Bdellovibrionota bacterium]